ncbi:hypothetical protein [Burkholderia sp. PU8-34]
MRIRTAIGFFDSYDLVASQHGRPAPDVLFSAPNMGALSVVDAFRMYATSDGDKSHNKR